MESLEELKENMREAWSDWCAHQSECDICCQWETKNYQDCVEGRFLYRRLAVSIDRIMKHGTN